MIEDQIPAILAIIIGGTSLIIFTSRFTASPTYLRNRIKDREAEIKDLHHKFNVVKGQFYRLNNTRLVDSEDAEKVQKSTNPAEIIPTILNNAAPHLPKVLGQLAKNTTIQGYLQGLAKKYPSESKEFLAGLLPKIAHVSEGPPTPKGL